MGLVSFSQNGIPQQATINFDYCIDSLPLKMVVNGDTLFLITLKQLVRANVTYQEKEKYHELLDSLKKAYDNVELALIAQSDLISSLRKEGQKYDGILSTQATIMKNDSIIQKQQFLLLKQGEKSALLGKVKDGVLYTVIAITLGLLGYTTFRPH